MNKTLVLIFLEMFTIRNLKKFSNVVIYHSRDFIKYILKEASSYEIFRYYCSKRSLNLPNKEHNFVSSFLTYLKDIDNIF